MIYKILKYYIEIEILRNINPTKTHTKISKNIPPLSPREILHRNLKIEEH